MTPDLTTRAVDVMVTEHSRHGAIFERGCRCGDWPHPQGDDIGPWWAEFDRHVQASVWRALLAARTNCETCSGRSTDQSVAAVAKFKRTGQLTDCPTCGGSGRGDGLLVAILMERITDMTTIAVHRVTREPAYWSTSEQTWYPVYVERPVDQP